jgi:hypothetical protein
MKFKNQTGPSKSHFWPEVEDICWVSTGNYLCKVSVPFVATVPGRAYGSILQAGEIKKQQLL